MALSEVLSSSSIVSRVLGAKLKNPFKRTGGYLVLDIGSSSVKLAEVQHGTVAARASPRSGWRRCRRR